MHAPVSDATVWVDLERGPLPEINFRFSGDFTPWRNTEPQVQLPENTVQRREPGIAIFGEGLVQGLTSQTGLLCNLGKTPRLDDVAERDQ